MSLQYYWFHRAMTLWPFCTTCNLSAHRIEEWHRTFLQTPVLLNVSIFRAEMSFSTRRMMLWKFNESVVASLYSLCVVKVADTKQRYFKPDLLWGGVDGVVGQEAAVWTKAHQGQWLASPTPCADWSQLYIQHRLSLRCTTEHHRKSNPCISMFKVRRKKRRLIDCPNSAQLHWVLLAVWII